MHGKYPLILLSLLAPPRYGVAMKNQIFVLFWVLNSLGMALANADSSLPFHQWVLHCDGEKKSISGAPYSEDSRIVTWNLDANTDVDVHVTKVFPPFTDPSSQWIDSEKIQSINVNPIFAPGCRTQCDAQQLSLHVEYLASGLQEGVGMSKNTADVIVPVQSLSVGTPISLKNTWVSFVNECDRGNCITDTSGNEILNCVVQSIQN
jgi:hypothetical protein